MRIFLASDIHGEKKALTELPARARAQGAELVVLAGDISHKGRPKNFIEDIVRGFAPLPVIAVPGNLDPVEVHDRFASAGAVWVHARREVVSGIGFAGMGGSTPHLLGGPYQVAEEAIEAGLAGALPDDVLVLHCPPRDTLDRTRIGIRAGSRAAARVVGRLRPRLVLCGHIHEARGVLEREGTVYVNAGPGKSLRSALIAGDASSGWKAELS